MRSSVQTKGKIKYLAKTYDKINTIVNRIIKHLEKNKNILSTNYNKGKIESANNKIKIIKRVSYGYLPFDNFTLRIFLFFTIKKYGLGDNPQTIYYYFSL